MHRTADRSSSRRDTVLFLVCLILSAAALLTPTRWTLSFANAVRETALLPLVLLQQRAEEGRTSRALLRETMAQRDSAAITAQTVTGLRVENERLRGLLGLRTRESGSFVAAEVLHQSLPADGRTLLLSAGSRAGVHPYQPVIAPEGLVGVVSRVGPTTSMANSWAHAEFRVSAVTADGAVLGIVAPSASADPSLTVLEFRGVAYRDTVPDGTLVLTSGLGGVYPRGIPIGQVKGVRREELGWERVYRLIPMVNPGVVSHVLLLTFPAESSAAAPTDSFP